MKGSIKRKLMILIIVPFAIGYIINLLLGIGIKIDSSILLSFMGVLIYVWGFGAIFFWFYVGMQFGKLEMPKLKSLILGNSLWIISFILYLWQFILLDDKKRNLFISGISQNYNIGFVNISSRIISLFTNMIDGNTVIVLSYIIMLIVFIIGFIYTAKNRYRKFDV